MPTVQTQQICETLRQWLRSRLDSSAMDWVSSRCVSIGEGKKKDLFLGFGLVSRKIPKTDFSPNAEELEQAESIRTGWDPSSWTLQDLSRLLLVLHSPSEDAEMFLATLDQLFATGEVHELVALYQGLLLFPFPEQLKERAGEGIRTNMLSVFKAVALNNIYPSEFLDEGMWNQMVLKCLFVGETLDLIVGLDSRINSALSNMLCDYAHERWAASRPVHPELWRCVQPEQTPTGIEDLKRVLEQGTLLEKQAAILSASQSNLPEASQLVDSEPELKKQLESGEFDWASIALDAK